MFMSNKVGTCKSDAKAQSASGLPRNTKSDVRDDIKKAVAATKKKGNFPPKAKKSKTSD